MARRRFWRDVRGRQSRDRGGARACAEDGGGGDAPRAPGGRGCTAGLAQPHRRRPRANHAPLGRPDTRAPRRSCPPAHARAGQAARRVGGRDPLRGVVPRVVRRGGKARLRRYDPLAASGPADPRPQAAGRCVSRDHSLELPFRDGDAQGCSRAGGGLHDGAEAGRADAVVCARGRRARRRGGAAGRRTLDRHRRFRGRTGDRSRADLEPARPQGRLHRLQRGRQAPDGPVRQRG